MYKKEQNLADHTYVNPQGLVNQTIKLMQIILNLPSEASTISLTQFILSLQFNPASFQLRFLRLRREVFYTYHVTYFADNLIQKWGVSDKLQLQYENTPNDKLKNMASI